MTENSKIPIFERYPGLRGALPHAALGSFPTPVLPLKKLGRALNLSALYMKQDGLSGSPFGGNKVRKLEFLLGEAIRQEAGHVLTFGAAGSNHALATAVFSLKLGLKPVSILADQPNAQYVRRNLLMQLSTGGQCRWVPDAAAMKRMAFFLRLWIRLKSGRTPFVIPPGGSTPLGACGFVNAALELSQQIQNGVLQVPDRIYVPLGTMATAAGLVLGAKAAGLKSTIVAARVVPETMADEILFLRLIEDTNRFLHRLDSGFPQFGSKNRGIEIRHEGFGEMYALFTSEGMNAVRMMEETEGIRLDGTYTGKALSVLIRDARAGLLRDKTVLFWNTLNAQNLDPFISGQDYRRLPKAFHRYFIEEVQELERIE